MSAEVIRVRPGAGWGLRLAETADLEALAQLRATVLRADLERLGCSDGHRVRQRMWDTFAPGYTSVILVDGEPAGCVTLRPGGDRHWLEHFYLAPHHQSRGWGSAVLATILEHADAQGVTVGLNVLQGSAARRLYDRHGFVVEAQDPVDVFMVRPPVPRPA